MKLAIAGASTILLAAVAGVTVAAPVTYNVDSQHTYPAFEADHMGGLSIWRGKVDSTSGKVVLDTAAKTGSVDVTMEMKSIDFGMAKMNEHAVSPDIFDVAKFPTATFSGSMNFVDQTLSMKLHSVLSPKLAEAVGGTSIGGYLTAAVRTANGELIIPTLVSGTLTRPRLVPDAPAIAKLKLQNAVPNVIDAVKGGKVGLKDILDILGAGGKKKQ